MAAAIQGSDNSLNPNKIKYVNDSLQRRFDGISAESGNLPYQTLLAAPGQRILEFDFREGVPMNFEDELSALSHFEEQKSMIDYTQYTTVED